MTFRKDFTRRARLLLTCLGAAALIVAAAAGCARFYALLKTAAEAAARNAVTQAVNLSVREMISSREICCDDIITIVKDDDGRVAALKTDAALAELVSAEVSSRVREAVAESGQNLSIPIGTAFGGALLSGRGVKIPVKIVSVGAVSARMKHGFTESGINQTLHSLVLCVEVELGILLPGKTVSVRTSDEVYISETIIVGGVPENYTYFADNGELGSVLDKYDIVN